MIFPTTIFPTTIFPTTIFPTTIFPTYEAYHETTLLFFSLWVLDALCTHPIHAQPYQPNWESLDKRPVPTWFADAKFGIFIHWGVYAVPAYRPIRKERYASYAEWYQVDVMNKPGKGREFHDNTYGRNFAYRDFAPMFQAELFNPQDWAKLFKMQMPIT